MSLEIIVIIISIIVGVYEVFVRFVPTVSDWSVLGTIMRILLYISNALNSKKESSFKSFLQENKK